MLEEKIGVCKALLSEYFRCEITQLGEMFEVLRGARCVFGEGVFKNAIKEIFSDLPGGEPPAFEAYFCVVNSVIKDLGNLEDIDDSTDEFLCFAYVYYPNVRFRAEYLKDLSVASDKISLIVQKLNEFFDLFGAYKKVSGDTTIIKGVCGYSDEKEVGIKIEGGDGIMIPRSTIRSRFDDKLTSPQTFEIDSWIFKKRF